MKKLFNVLVLLLAMNFLVVAGAVGWLFQTGRLDRGKMSAIRTVVFPPPASPASAAKPVEPATTQPTFKLEELLAKSAGRPPAEQLEDIRRSFDTQMAQLDRRQRGLQDLQRQVLAGQKQLADDRVALEVEKKKFAAEKQEAARLATDKGFQDSLALYESLPPKNVKTVFMTLDDATIIQYLQTMESSKAAKIMKEFKSPQETERLKTILERMRQPQASAKG